MGLFGIIEPTNGCANYGEPLRKWFKQQGIHEIIDFGDLPVFQGATTYPCIVIASPNHIASFFSANVDTLDFESLDNYVQKYRQLSLIDSLA